MAELVAVRCLFRYCAVAGRSSHRDDSWMHQM